MKSFLEEIAHEILSCSEDLRKLEVIVPNRRTGLFLKKAIAAETCKTIWMPKITTIQELFILNSDLHQAEELLLIYKLFEIFKKHTNTKETFDDFYYWGEVIINDFDDIDKYLVDAHKLFSTIKDIKEIDKSFDGYDEEELKIIKRFWININQANISDQKKSFLELWEKMYDIYHDFREALYLEKIAYQGLIYRTVANNIQECNFDKQIYAVVGFNALNKCEKTMFNWLKSNKETMFFWDADKYYLKDEYQEAGRFLRENIRKFPPIKNVGIINTLNIEKKNIEIITAPSPVSQVKIIPDILEKWKAEPDFIPEKTAIVLGDENLLIPLIYSIPPDFEPYNVSMGFPVKNTATAALITHLISLQYNSRYSDGISKFYFKDVFSIINHNFIKKIFPEETQIIENKINLERLIYINSEELHLNDLFSMIFCCKYSKVIDISAYLSDICYELIALLSGKEDFLVEVEFLNKISSRINILHKCIVIGKVEISKSEIYYKLLNNSIRSLSVAFEGEPLEGLQVLGFLETRCLDFDRVVMLSLNEGVFPKSSTSQSLIPYNLRKFYELPSIEFQDSIFAYYFYRILQRAKDIKIIYSSQAGDGSSETSRFISQIKYEFDRETNNIEFRNNGYKININAKPAIYATKTVNILEKVRKHLNNGISPKAINEYLNCGFKYYLSYIENIKEPDKIEEEEDGAFFGRLFHQIVQCLYEPYTGKLMTEADLDRIAHKENIKKATTESLIKVFNIKSELELEKYHDKLIVDIVLKYVYKLIEYDKNNLPFTIIGLESEKEFILNINDNLFDTVRIKGYIDRIDLKENKYEVLDYKTGSVEMKTATIEKLFIEDRDPKSNTITQVFLYALMMNKADGNEICPGVLNVNELNSGYDYRITLGKSRIDDFNDEIRNEFIKNLTNVFTEMLNDKINFRQTNNINSCKYCPYNIICDRN